MLGLTYTARAALAAFSVFTPQPRKGPVPRAATCPPGGSTTLQVAATTDVHGHERGWDYYEGAPDSARGLARAATIVDSIRAANPGRVLLVDAGDILQGTPFAYVTAHAGRPNSIIAAMNAMRYDAAAIGNHEFNYGVPYLDSAIAQARFPFLAANATRSARHAPFARYVIVRRAGVKVGIVGATTPGSNLWDAANLAAARVRIGDIVPAVRASIRDARASGADAVFDTSARLGPGPITAAQLARLYPYDNTLRAIRISGAQLRAYLEHSSRYYRTNAAGSLVQDTSVAGYNFDVVNGVDYRVDLSKPEGQRVISLTRGGRAVAPTDSFTLALNNYRQTGGGGYAMLRGAPVVYDRQQEIRELLADEVRRRGTLHASDYDSMNWSFVKQSPDR